MIRRCLTLLVSAVFCLPLIGHAAEPQVAHMVYFKLADPSDDAKEKLVAACNKYLAGHEGTVYYSAGVMAEDLARDVNDRDFDVSLNVVFRNKAAHDQYQTHERHLQFIEENKESWASVRVFDSYIQAPVQRDRVRVRDRVRERDRVRDRFSLPDPAKKFAGMITGTVVNTREGRIVVEVTAVPRQWEHSKATNADSMIGKRVLVDGRGNDRIGLFVKGLKAGETVSLDVANKEGETLTILELTEEQRERIKQ